ncbi:DUF4259 domain-containing protein [Blastopirellula marina]|uniref:DUF4259 domain-containing protein n=1 Tax=Blastopirellula marina DSM 3645 TaxID=314230 RepID=A3ZLQ6_9BACT|nr:DUF4259 domain-containing protein [Blastopirellula marina]EAQ82689.1 hypothetical protein DSM3645_09827 [Blastopirellula marina DSM 3645]
MGTFGTGVFDNDGALDFVCEMVSQLTDKINTCFEDGSADLEEEGDAVLLPAVAVISLLAKNCHAAPPDLEVIYSWRERFLAIYDQQIDDLDPEPAYKAERRQVVEATFEDLVTLAKMFAEE